MTGFRIFAPRSGEQPTLKPKSSLQRLIEQNRRASLTTGAGIAQADVAPLGKEKAAVVFVELEKRNKTWEQLVTHLQGLGMGALCANRIPPEVSAGVLPFARKYCAGFPAVKDVVPGRAQQLIDGWTPPPPQHDVIDKTTGEVMKPGKGDADLDLDDIPF